MRKAAPILVAVLLAPAVFAGEVQVRPNGGRLDLIATAAPVQDVLTRLSQQTGMKVVYEGAPPRTLVTVSLPQRTPVEAVLSLFEGLGLNYALSTDKTGTKVEMLIISAATPGTGASSRTATAPPAAMPTPDPRRLPPQRPQPAPDADRDEEEQQVDEDGARPQPTPVPSGPVIFQGPIPGPGVPGSPFGNQIGPLTLPTPVPMPAGPAAPVRPTPAPSPTPSTEG